MESETSKTCGSKTHQKRGPCYSLTEDETLCKAWLAVKEQNAVKGLSRGSNTFDRVLEVYNEFMGASSGRTAKALSNRWLTIQQHVSTFCGYLNQLQTTKRTDASLQAPIAGAKRLFCVSQKCDFKWEGCWEILKDSPRWQEYQVMKSNIYNANKKMKPMLEIDSIAMEGASSTPATPGSQPSTPGKTHVASNINLTCIDVLPREEATAMKVEQVGEKKSDEQIIHLSKVVEELNSLLRTFISSTEERLGRTEDIARRNLQLKEERIRQRQLEMREHQFDIDRKIMDMNLDHMPLMQRQFYEIKQKEICDRLKIGEPNFGSVGSSGGELECGEGPEMMNGIDQS